jgi:kynurenine formamidase
MGHREPVVGSFLGVAPVLSAVEGIPRVITGDCFAHSHRLRLKLLLAMTSFLISFLSISPLSFTGENMNLTDKKTIDLTHPFDEKTIYWPTEKGFVFEKEFEGMTDKGYYYAAGTFSAPEHGGTHIDAPFHFNREGKTVDQIPLEQLIGEAVLIDVSKKAEKNRDYRITPEDFIEWEKANGMIPKGSIVLLRTGFGKFWPDRLNYLGTEERGKEAVAKLHFPGLGPEAARWLSENRSPKAVGLDTASIDYGQSKLFETHRILFEKNIPAFENLANLEQLPMKGFQVIALPMKIKGGSGGPLRIVAVIH